MQNKYFEIFKLRYEKIINSAQIIYNTLSTHNTMAFSLTKLAKETDLYIQAIVINKLINSHNLTLELLLQIDACAKEEHLLKSLKINKVKEINDKFIKKLNKLVCKIIDVEPKVIKLAVYFDKYVSKLNINDNDIKACEIILHSFKCMFALIDDKDDAKTDLSIYNEAIKIVSKYINEGN